MIGVSFRFLSKNRKKKRQNLTLYILTYRRLFGNRTFFDFCLKHVESSGDRKEKPSSADRHTDSPYINNRESLSSQQPLTN